MTSVTAKGKSTARRARRQVQSSAVAEATGRFGLAARGVVYCVVAILTVHVAVGDRGQEADREGALTSVARQPFGWVLLVVLAAGFASYAAWRLLKAATGAPEGGKRDDGAKGIGKRAGDAGRALLYGSALISTISVIRSGRAGGKSDDEDAKAWSATLMTAPAGRWLVAAIGAGLIVIGVVTASRAVRQKFGEHLALRKMSKWQRWWLPMLGTVGRTGRAVVIGLVGAFLIEAAVRFDPNRAAGLDGALHRLAEQPFGPFLLLLVAFALGCFGLFSFVEARWRKVLDG